MRTAAEVTSDFPATKKCDVCGETMRLIDVTPCWVHNDCPGLPNYSRCKCSKEKAK